MNTMKKIQGDKNGCKYILFRADIYFSECFLAVQIDEKGILTETLFLRKKHKKHQKKNLGCKIIRINTSNAKNGYDLDYGVASKKVFVGQFKNKK